MKDGVAIAVAVGLVGAAVYLATRKAAASDEVKAVRSNVSLPAEQRDDEPLHSVARYNEELAAAIRVVRVMRGLLGGRGNGVCGLQYGPAGRRVQPVRRTRARGA